MHIESAGEGGKEACLFVFFFSSKTHRNNFRPRESRVSVSESFSPVHTTSDVLFANITSDSDLWLSRRFLNVAYSLHVAATSQHVIKQENCACQSQEKKKNRKKR